MLPREGISNLFYWLCVLMIPLAGTPAAAMGGDKYNLDVAHGGEDKTQGFFNKFSFR